MFVVVNCQHQFCWKYALVDNYWANQLVLIFKVCFHFQQQVVWATRLFVKPCYIQVGNSGAAKLVLKFKVCFHFQQQVVWATKWQPGQPSGLGKRLFSSCLVKPAGYTGGSRCPTLGGNHSCKKFWIIMYGDFNCHCNDFAFFFSFYCKTENLAFVWFGQSFGVRWNLICLWYIGRYHF